MIEPLICSASPRDIPDFTAAIKKIPVDKLFAKYHTEREAYRVLREMFLDTKKYTHMIICPDDLIVQVKDYEILLNDVKEFDYPVIGGIFNINYQNMDTYVAAKKLSPFRLFTNEELFADGPIKQVAFDGFAFTFVRRDVVKDIEFHSKEYSSTAFDVAFATECQKYDIPIHVDTRAKMLHLANRKGDGTHENMGFGKKPTLIFEQYN